MDGVRRKNTNEFVSQDSQTHVRRFYHPHTSSHHASSASGHHFSQSQHTHTHGHSHGHSHLVHHTMKTGATVTNGSTTQRERNNSHTPTPVQREVWLQQTAQIFAAPTVQTSRKHSTASTQGENSGLSHAGLRVFGGLHQYQHQSQPQHQHQHHSQYHSVSQLQQQQQQPQYTPSSINTSVSSRESSSDSSSVRKKPSLPNISEHDVQRLEYIGCGTNASVFTCLYDGAMACEKVLTSELKSEQNHEAAVMLFVDRHPNVLRMYGLCKRSNGETSIILELMQTDLLHKLQKATPTDPTSQYLQAIDYLLQAARGLRFLNRIGVVHRDVAARNMLISGNCLKIADFGLAKDTQKNRNTADLPKPLSTAPEAIRNLDNPEVWGECSDVWSYGLFVWEVISGGRDPLEEFHNSVPALLTALNHGWQPARLQEFSDLLWKLMQQCLSLEPARRPTFDRIIAVLMKCQGEASMVTYREERPQSAQPMCFEKVVEPIIHSSRISHRNVSGRQ